MKQRMNIGIVTAMALAVGAWLVPSASLAASAPSGLSGTWQGSFSEIGGVLYVAEGECVVHVNRDGTFTAWVTPAPGANNLVKGSQWSGTVVREGDRVKFRAPNGSWTTLVQRGDTLYGVSNDPKIEADVMIKLDRAAG